MNNQENQAVEIDVFAMLKTLWKRKFSIVLSLSLPSQHLAIVPFNKKEYQSTSWIYVSRQNHAQQCLRQLDLQAGSYLVKDYREIILSKCIESGHR